MTDKDGSVSTSTSSVAGLLLTGGTSSRMGVDKAAIRIGDQTLARRIASKLCEVVTPTLEIGPGWTGLESILETPRGQGPLVAIAAGHDALVQRGHHGPTIVLACDMPFVTVRLITLLAQWPGSKSVVPIVDGRDQTLCARWSYSNLGRARALVERGERSLRHLLRRDEAILLVEAAWSGVATVRTFADVDTPDDLQRFDVGAIVE